MKLRRTTFLALVTICSWSLAAGQSSDAVDQFVRAEMEKQHIPGLALLVSRSGQPIRQQGYGLSNVELQVPVKPETIFQSGSVGKQFTATAVMMLVEEGKIALDDPLTKFFLRIAAHPQIPLLDSIVPLKVALLYYQQLQAAFSGKVTPLKAMQNVDSGLKTLSP